VCGVCVARCDCRRLGARVLPHWSPFREEFAKVCASGESRTSCRFGEPSDLAHCPGHERRLRGAVSGQRTSADSLSGWPDLNRRPLDPQSSALTKLRHSPSVVLRTHLGDRRVPHPTAASGTPSLQRTPPWATSKADPLTRTVDPTGKYSLGKRRPAALACHARDGLLVGAASPEAPSRMRWKSIPTIRIGA
jgi:hypothetical protein